MEQVKQNRLIRLVAKVTKEGLDSLTLNEGTELERLLRVRVAENEFGYPIYSDDDAIGLAVDGGVSES